MLPELGGAGGGTEEERTGAAIDEPLIEQEKGRRDREREKGRRREGKKISKSAYMCTCTCICTIQCCYISSTNLISDEIIIIIIIIIIIKMVNFLRPLDYIIT